MEIQFDKEFLAELEMLEDKPRWDSETEAYLLKIMEKTNSTAKALKILNKYFPDRNFTYGSIEAKKRRLKPQIERK